MRPKIAIDWQEVDKLILKGWTKKQIQTKLHVSPITLDRRCKEEKGINFKNYKKQLNNEN
jgi:AraC-like DNA-binding protein